MRVLISLCMYTIIDTNMLSCKSDPTRLDSQIKCFHGGLSELGEVNHETQFNLNNVS